MELDGRNPGKDQQARSLSRPGGPAVRCALIRVGAARAREGGAAPTRAGERAAERADPERAAGRAAAERRSRRRSKWGSVRQGPAGAPYATGRAMTGRRAVRVGKVGPKGMSASSCRPGEERRTGAQSEKKRWSSAVGGGPAVRRSQRGGRGCPPPTHPPTRARRCGTCCCATGSSRRRRSGAPSGRRATAPGKLLRVADRATASESLIRVASEPLIRVAFESLTRMQPHPASCRRPHGRRRITRIASHCGTELQFLFMFHDETAVAGQVASPVQGRVKLSQKMRTAPFGRAAAAGDARRLLPPTHNF